MKFNRRCTVAMAFRATCSCFCRVFRWIRILMFYIYFNPVRKLFEVIFHLRRFRFYTHTHTHTHTTHTHPHTTHTPTHHTHTHTHTHAYMCIYMYVCTYEVFTYMSIYVFNIEKHNSHTPDEESVELFKYMFLKLCTVGFCMRQRSDGS